MVVTELDDFGRFLENHYEPLDRAILHLLEVMEWGYSRLLEKHSCS